MPRYIPLNESANAKSYSYFAKYSCNKHTGVFQAISSSIRGNSQSRIRALGITSHGMVNFSMPRQSNTANGRERCISIFNLDGTINQNK